MTTDTISCGLKEVLRKAGIQNFTGHSTRVAPSSAAKRSNVDLGTILQAVGWTNDKTFSKFYNKRLATDTNFCQALLQNA